MKRRLRLDSRRYPHTRILVPRDAEALDDIYEAVGISGAADIALQGKIEITFDTEECEKTFFEYLQKKRTPTRKIRLSP